MTQLEILRNFAASGRAARLVFAVILSGLASAPALHAAIEFQRLKSFGYPDLAGANPSGPLIQASDGAFYGAARGGYIAAGTVFKLDKDGGGYHVLHRFNPADGDGTQPVG